MKLKADFHLHTNADPRDSHVVHTGEQLIDRAAKLGFDCLAITNHDVQTWSESLKEYAAARGILLIPGVELTVQGCHIVLLNFTTAEIRRIKTVKDIAQFTGPDRLVIAPHPFYPCAHSLKDKVERNPAVFDALEITSLYFRWINFNGKAERLAQQCGLPLIGSSDTHFLYQLGLTHSLIDAEKNIPSVFGAIKSGQVRVVSRPLTLTWKDMELAINFTPLLSNVWRTIKRS